MESGRTNEEKRQPYGKPLLRTIDLAADEVLGGNCKVNSGTPGGRLGGLCLLDGCATETGS
jgi:hypothetical protein